MAEQYRDHYAEQRAMRDLHPKTRAKVIGMLQNHTVIDGESYSTETGENITDRIHTELVITEPQRRGKRTQENLAQHQTDNGGFIFAYYEVCKSMGDRFPFLTKSDTARLLFIGTYLSWETNHIVYDNGRKVDKKALGDLLNMSRNKYGDFYKTLIENGILSEAESGLVMNPTVFYRGTEKKIRPLVKGMQFTRLFKNTVRDLYAKFNGRSIKKLGVIYAVLPYVNFNFNTVCHNPQEVKVDDIIPMTLSELADKLGYADYRKLVPVLREIRYEDKPIFKFVDGTADRRDKYIIVNPRIVYAGNGKHLDGIKLLFN